MGRNATIDRDRVLDVAETLLLKKGTGALTIDAVAKAAGISKGGVQSSFGTKSGLIAAMIERFGRDYDAQMAARVGPTPTPLETVRGHAETTMTMDTETYARAAGMMAALIDAREHIVQCRAWYQEILGSLDLRTDTGRRAQLAFLATEGAFMLRAFGFMEFSEDDWDGIRQNLQALLDGDFKLAVRKVANV